MLKVTVSAAGSGENRTFEIEHNGTQSFIGGELFDGDLVKTDPGHFHIIWKNKSYVIEVTSAERETKTVHLLINGHPYSTVSKDHLDLLLEKMGIQAGSSQKSNHVKAPMPGLIHSVFVSDGQPISKGDPLLVLVAMKMENVIKAAGDGIVKSLKVTAGQIVEKNQVLLEIE